MIFFFYIKKIIISIIQKIANYFFSFLIIYDEKYLNILKIKNRVKYSKSPYLQKQTIGKVKKKVIFEMFNVNENILAFYFWSIVFRFKNHDCFVYPLKINSPFYNPKSFLIYKKLGFKFIDWKISYQQELEIKKELKKINLNKINKKEFLNLKIKQIIVGDLIYDHYLRYNSEPTLKLDSIEIKSLLYKAIKILIFWDDYFKFNNVSNFCFSHSPYLLGIPNRVAIKHNIDSINIAGNSVYRFNKKTFYLGDQLRNAKKLLNNFYKRIGSKNALKIKKKYRKDFIDIVTGKNKNIIGTLAFNQKNTFKKIKKKNKLIIKNKFKILIAGHDFYEGPNVWGKFLFPDFYEWILFLSNYINKDKKNNRVWFIKPHPDASLDQIKIIRNIIKDNKKIKILSSNVTHRQLIDMKINFILTARGSVGYQYAYFGINTLLCSNISLYNDFNYVLKSKSIHDYTSKLNNLEILSKRKINLEGVINFYLMLNIYIWCQDNEFIFPNINLYLKKRKIIFNQARTEKYTVDTFPFIIKHLTNKQIEKIFLIIDNFLNDKKKLMPETKFIK